MTPFAAWLDAVRFAADVQRVVALRMMRLAANDAKAATEAYGMVGEKVAALMDSQMALVRATARGQRPQVALKRALTPYRRRVRANLRRLSR